MQGAAKGSMWQGQAWGSRSEDLKNQAKKSMGADFKIFQ